MENEARAFNRLHALTRKGYTPKIGKGAADATIELRHLGKEPDLILHPDGRVEELGGRIPRHKRKLQPLEPIPARKEADEIRFLTFLDSVKRPTLRDRTRPLRRKYVYAPAGIITLLGLSAGFSAALFG